MTDLFPTWVVGSLNLTEYPYSVDRDNTVEVGEPEMVVEGTVSLLADGDIERVVRHGNRTYVLPVYVEGPTLLDVAEAEAALRSEVRRQGLELTHDPGDGFAPPSVYEVQSARMAVSRDDTHESHLMRKYTLTLTCGPFARSAAPVTIEALGPPPVTPTIVSINDATSTTGWTARLSSLMSGDSTPTVSDLGVDGVSAAGVGTSLALHYVPSAPVSLSGTKYLTVETSGTSPLGLSVSYSDSIYNVSPTVASVRAAAGGKTAYVLEVDETKSLDRFVLFTDASEDRDLFINAFDISRTDTLPQVSARQITRIVEVGGTERTPGSIHVQTADGTGSLGLTIVHTSPEDGSGYSPPLRRWRVAASTGPVSADAAALSGNREPIGFFGGGFYAEVPTSAIPEGGYVLVARMRSLAVQTKNLYWSASTIFPDATTQEGYVSGSLPYSFPDTNWHLIPLAALSLPSVRTSAGKVQILLQAESGGAAQVELDEGWLFRADDDCALTILETTRPHLWLDSADQSSPVPRVWVGDGAATKVHPGTGLLAQGTHVLSPDGTALFTAAMTDNPAADATFFRRWHSNAAS